MKNEPGRSNFAAHLLTVEHSSEEKLGISLLHETKDEKKIIGTGKY